MVSAHTAITLFSEDIANFVYWSFGLGPNFSITGDSYSVKLRPFMVVVCEAMLIEYLREIADVLWHSKLDAYWVREIWWLIHRRR